MSRPRATMAAASWLHPQHCVSSFINRNTSIPAPPVQRMVLPPVTSKQESACSVHRGAWPITAVQVLRRRSCVCVAASLSKQSIYTQLPTHLDQPSEGFDSIQSALDDLAAGKFVVVLDDEDRENEGDLIIAADKMTTESMAFMVEYTSGVVCIAMEGSDLDRLRLPLMVRPWQVMSHQTVCIWCFKPRQVHIASQSLACGCCFQVLVLCTFICFFGHPFLVKSSMDACIHFESQGSVWLFTACLTAPAHGFLTPCLTVLPAHASPADAVSRSTAGKITNPCTQHSL